MRITDRSPIGRGLQTIFFPAEPKPVMPSDVSDEVVLVHPALPPMVAFKESRFFHSQTLGVVGATEVVGPLVPTDRYWWIQFAHVFHNDGATARVLGLAIRDTVPNEVRILQETTTRVDNQPLSIARPLNLPNDTRLVGVVNAIDGAKRLTLEFFFLEFLHAEINPAL